MVLIEQIQNELGNNYIAKIYFDKELNKEILYIFNKIKNKNCTMEYIKENFDMNIFDFKERILNPILSAFN